MSPRTSHLSRLNDGAGQDGLRAARILVDDAIQGAIPTWVGLDLGTLLAKCPLTYLWQVPAFAPDSQGVAQCTVFRGIAFWQ